MDYFKNINKYLLVPIAMLLSIIYVYYNKKYISRNLVDPGDGSPEVLEISEESAKLNDYILAAFGSGAIVFLSIYFSSKGNFIENSENVNTNSNGISTNSNEIVKNSNKISNGIPNGIPRNSNVRQLGESIRTGPAGF